MRTQACWRNEEAGCGWAGLLRHTWQPELTPTEESGVLAEWGNAVVVRLGALPHACWELPVRLCKSNVMQAQTTWPEAPPCCLASTWLRAPAAPLPAEPTPQEVADVRAKAAAAGVPSQTITDEEFRELEEKQQVWAIVRAVGLYVCVVGGRVGG